VPGNPGEFTIQLAPVLVNGTLVHVPAVAFAEQHLKATVEFRASHLKKEMSTLMRDFRGTNDGRAKAASSDSMVEWRPRYVGVRVP
jgi:hypothetical protein